MAMMDQLALYRIDTASLEAILQRDLLMDRELPEHLERKGRFVNDIFLDGASVGKLLASMSTILGTPVDALVRRTNHSLEPSGPVTWTSRIPPDTLQLIIKSLAKGRRLLSSPGDDAATAARLVQLAEEFGGTSQTTSALRQIEQLLQKASSGSGELVAVFTCWAR